MRMSFSNTNVARAAVGVLEAYGYTASRVGADVVTDCPALLAVPVIGKRVGLAEIESVDLSGGGAALQPDAAALVSPPVYEAVGARAAGGVSA